MNRNYLLAAVIAAVGMVIATNWDWFVGGREPIEVMVTTFQTPASLPSLSCGAYPSEDYQDYTPCPTGTETLVEWCSGDCNGDDARVRICCQWETEKP